MVRTSFKQGREFLDQLGDYQLLKKNSAPKGLNECMYIPVMLFLNKMVASSECNQVCIVGWCRYGHRSRAPHICV